MVRVRGKRPRKQSTPTLPGQFRRGRPKTEHAPEGVSKKEALLKLQQHHFAKGQTMNRELNHLSALEKLPIELIQHVFFHSLELNLTRASRTLRAALSTDNIRNALIAFAYFDDDGQSPVEGKHFLPAEYWRLSIDEKIRLQRSLFQYGITTYSRLKACLPTLSRLVMAQAWHREHLLEDMHEETWSVTRLNMELVVANKDLLQAAPLPPLQDESAIEKHYFARRNLVRPLVEDNQAHSAIEHTFIDYLPRIITWTSSIDDDHVVHKSTDQSVTIVACRHIPGRILTGPWSEDDLKLLRLLRQGYTFIQEDHVMHISAEHVFRGMRHAIDTGNTEALTVLLDMQSIFFKSGSWGLASMVSTELIAASNHPLPIELFRLAAQQGPKAAALLSLLIRGGIDSLSSDDDILTAWALKAKRDPDAAPLASWLLRHMEGNVSYGLPRRRHLFVDGCLSWRAGGDLPFLPRSFARELGYLDGTPIVPAGVDGEVCGGP